jgi:rod shape determining protein RodA
LKILGYISKTFRGVDKRLYLMPLLLAGISIMMMVSTSYEDGAFTDHTVLIQSAAYVLGFILVVIIANISYTAFADIEKWLYIGSLVFLLLVYVPGLGLELNGARSWINLGFTTFQPSEIVKITFVLLFAKYLVNHKEELRYLTGVLKALLYCAPFIAIVLKEDLGSALVFMAMWLIMIFYAGIRGSLFAKGLAVVALLVPVGYNFMAAHQKERINAFLHPDNLSIGANYQVWQSKVAIGSGGFFGKGLFHGTQKGLKFLPVRNSDFVFSVIIEELGFIGGAIVITAYSFFIYAAMKVVKQCSDAYGSLIVIGFIAMFTFQIFENIAMTMGIMPVTGITLPFVSYGGSSVLANMMAVGFIINIAAHSKVVQF